MSYIHLENSELATAAAALGATQDDKSVALLARINERIAELADPEIEAIDEAYRQAAINNNSSEGVLEIDDGALVSKGAEDGAYVMAWVWVYASDAGISIDPEDEENVDDEE